MNKLVLFFAAFFLFVSPVFAIQEDFMLQHLDSGSVTRPIYKHITDFSDPYKVKITLNITEKISTRGGKLYTGMPLKFKVKTNIYSKGKLLLKRGEIVDGKITMLTTSGMNGTPYTITLGDFSFPNIDSAKITDRYSKDGANRIYWVLPLKWALTPLPPTGSLTNLIYGGHARITPKDDIVIYYFPNWI